MTDEQYGEAAFAAGLPCIPVHDRPFMDMLLAEPPASDPDEMASATVPLLRRLKAWHRGWAMANLAAPLPDNA